MNIVILTETPYKYPSLTGDMLFRLWKAAIKDDDTLANEVIRGIYDGMMAFAIMGGLFVATILTLIVLPALYVVFFRLREPTTMQPKGAVNKAFA